MIRFFKSSDRNHSRTSFKLIILLSEKHLVYRHLEFLAGGDFTTDERQITDRYQVGHFAQKLEFAGRQWQEIPAEEYKKYHFFWSRLRPKFLLYVPTKT